MIFDTLDLSTLERNAWQRGDYVLAQALAMAEDVEERATQAEDQLSENETDTQKNYAACQEAWADHNTKMFQRLDNLRQLVEQAARASGRELLLERIEEMERLIEETGEGKTPAEGYHKARSA